MVGPGTQCVPSSIQFPREIKLQYIVSSSFFLSLLSLNPTLLLLWWHTHTYIHGKGTPGQAGGAWICSNKWSAIADKPNKRQVHMDRFHEIVIVLQSVVRWTDRSSLSFARNRHKEHNIPILFCFRHRWYIHSLRTSGNVLMICASSVLNKL